MIVLLMVVAALALAIVGAKIDKVSWGVVAWIVMVLAIKFAFQVSTRM